MLETETPDEKELPIVDFHLQLKIGDCELRTTLHI
jgi:hypothetical protein